MVKYTTRIGSSKYYHLYQDCCKLSTTAHIVETTGEGQTMCKYCARRKQRGGRLNGRV